MAAGHLIGLVCIQGLGGFARLAYPAACMECFEVWAYGLMIMLAGLLPDPAQVVGALGITMELYDCLIQTAFAQSITLSTRSVRNCACA